MKQITIDELIPLMKDGYVCLDCHYRWFHFSKEPKLNEEGGYWHNGGKCTPLGFCFRIKRPHLNWKKSLRRVVNNEIQAKNIADNKIQASFDEIMGHPMAFGFLSEDKIKSEFEQWKRRKQ